MKSSNHDQIGICLMFFLASVLCAFAQAEDLNEATFKKDFKEEYWGRYTHNPSATCESLRGVGSVKIDMVPNEMRPSVRVIYYDKAEKVMGTKFYPISRAKIMSLESKTARPNSLLWESDVTGKSSGVGEKNYERMTFNEKVVSFDVLKTRDPQGLLAFFRAREVADKTRCNFTKTDAMVEPGSPARRPIRMEKRRTLQ